MKKILTIGAYERDNFGDLLFYVVVKLALRPYDCTLVPGSIIASDMRSTLGEYVYPYHFLLSQYKWDVVWSVGGEIGGMSIPESLKFSLSKEYVDEYLKLKGKARDAFIQYFVGKTNHHLAYLPDLSKYPENQDAMTVVNSVGAFETLARAPAALRDPILDTLRRAKAVAVRDAKSYDYLQSAGLTDVRLVPDSVQAISLYHQPEQTAPGKYFLFQTNQGLFNHFSVETVADYLHEVIEKVGLKMYLFSAGTANCHDSMEHYEKLVELIREKHPQNEIDVLRERNPLRLVDWIANSSLWIGTSLHGRIVSSAYSVPRVSFQGDKVNTYCDHWDSEYPYNITMPDMLSSCDAALSANRENGRQQSAKLAKLAKDNLDHILQKIYGTQ